MSFNLLTFGCPFPIGLDNSRSHHSQHHLLETFYTDNPPGLALFYYPSDLNTSQKVLSIYRAHRPDPVNTILFRLGMPVLERVLLAGIPS